jgi:hypothetical protein
MFWPPKWARNLDFDIGAADADVTQEAIIKFGQMAALAHAIRPSEQEIYDARNEAHRNLATREARLD